jgi:hypothetical protein
MEKQRRIVVPLDPSSLLGSRFVGTHFPNQTPVFVARTRNLEVGQCYSNCRSVVENEGGRVRCGFILLLCQGLFIEALHHAVWERPDGALEDITTPPYEGMDACSGCWFYPDDTVLGQDDAAIPSIFRRLTENENVRDWIRLTVARMCAYRDLLELDHTIVVEEDGQRKMAFKNPAAKPLHDKLDALTAQVRNARQTRWR